MDAAPPVDDGLHLEITAGLAGALAATAASAAPLLLWSTLVGFEEGLRTAFLCLAALAGVLVANVGLGIAVSVRSMWSRGYRGLLLPLGLGAGSPLLGLLLAHSGVRFLESGRVADPVSVFRALGIDGAAAAVGVAFACSVLGLFRLLLWASADAETIDRSVLGISTIVALMCPPALIGLDSVFFAVAHEAWRERSLRGEAPEAP